MNTMMKSLSGWITTLAFGVLGVGCGAGAPESQAPESLGQVEAELATPANSYNWGWGNVTNVTLNQSSNVVVASPGAAVSGNTSFYINAGTAGCSGCISQIVMGVNNGSKSCIYNGVGIVQSSAPFSLTAPTSAGLYPVWATPQWQYSCQDALNITGGGTSVGLIGVYADPYNWGWGRVNNVKLNGNGSHKIDVAPGAQFTLSTDYFIDAGQGGCPGCISQLVLGVEGGSKSCVYSGMGVVQRSASTFLTAPTSPGVYPVWAVPHWQYTCQDAYNISNGGTPIAFIQVK
jgi:hypothetical protein